MRQQNFPRLPCLKEKAFAAFLSKDLALELRQTLGDLGDWIQIMKNGVFATDLVLEMAYNSTAEYFTQFNNWSAAVECFELAKNRTDMIECYYHLEDYNAIHSMIESLSEGDPFLKLIGDTYATDAVCSTAVQAYTKVIAEVVGISKLQ